MKKKKKNYFICIYSRYIRLCVLDNLLFAMYIELLLTLELRSDTHTACTTRQVATKPYTPGARHPV